MSALGGAGAAGGGGGGTSPGACAAGSPGTTELLTVTVVRNDSGYGMKVSAANPVYVQSVKEGGAAWRAGLRAGDRIMRVNGVPVHTHTHEQVVEMIRASPNAVLTVYQNSQRLKTPITAPVPVDQEKQRQLEFTKVHTIKLMLENEQKHMEVLRNELSKASDPRKQAELESAEQRCLKLQHQIDIITSSLPAHQDLSSSTPQLSPHPQTPRLGNRSKYQTNLDKNPTAQTNSTGFLSGLPRSLSNLTGQSLRNLRQVRQSMTNKGQQENQPPLERQNSTEESRIKRSRHVHNNTVPMVPVTCLDGNIAPPPLPPRSTDRPQKPKRNPLSPPPSHIPINPLAKPPKILSPSSSMSQSPAHRWHSPQKEHSPYKSQKNITAQYSMDVPHAPLSHKSTSSPQYRREDPMSPQSHKYRRSAHSLDTDYGQEMGNGQPNSIAMQMSYPLIAHPQPPIQMDVRTGSGIPVLHVRSQSSPEHLDHALPYSTDQKDGQAWERTPPPGTPPPPYPHARPQPCDTQRAIISMEEDDSPTSDNSCHSGLFSNLRSVRESKARTAVLLNWLLGERRCASGNIFLLITDGYRSAVGVPIPTLRRWAYEIQSTFVMPHAVLALNGVDENIAREIDDILLNEYEKEELLRNVFRKARAKAKEELAQQLSEFQVKRQVGLGMLYGPEDSVLEKCDVDKAQESTVVERLIADRLKSLCSAGGEGDVWGCGAGSPPHAPLLAGTAAAALALHVSGLFPCPCVRARHNMVHSPDCEEKKRRWWSPKESKKLTDSGGISKTKPQVVTAAVGGGARAAFLQRDKHYKQRLKQIAKQTPHPLIVRGHHFSLQAVTSVADCQQCCTVIWGLAPQAYICTDCNLRVHRSCARKVEESCCLDGEQHNNRISRLLDKIHPNAGHEANEKKPRKTSATTHFLNMERSVRKLEDEQPWELHSNAQGKPNVTCQFIENLHRPPEDRRDESDESLYESADGNSDPISASDDALPRLGRLQAVSRESVKLAVTDEETDPRNKKGHRKALSLSNPIEMVKSLGDEWFESAKREIDKNSDKKKSKESLWSEEDRDSIHGSNAKLNERKNSKKDDKKKGIMDPPKSTRKVGSVSALNFLRRKKKTIETVAEKEDRITPPREAISTTTFFIEAEKRHSCECQAKPVVKAEVPEELQEESDEELEAEDEESEEQTPVKPLSGASRRRLSRTTSRSKSKVRGKSQTVRVNTLRKSQSGTLKRAKKKNVKGASGRSRNASVVELTPVPKKKTSDGRPPHYWLFSGSIKGDARREGSAEESACADAADPAHEPTLEKDDAKDGVLWRSLAAPGGKPVNRAESCREPAASSRRSKQRNASDPNRLTANKTHDCEPGAVAGAPSGSSSSSSLSSRSNESGAPAADQHASQSDWSEEEEPLAEQWIASVPQHIVDTLSSRLRKRQELIHELITSESSHVRWLKVLQTVFLRPLERGEHGQLLSPDEIKALFPNLPAVRERHNRLYADLKLLRKGDSPIVQIRPLAEAVLNTLGDASYATCLSRFCRGQRMALDALRERRRKNKELQHFLSTKEQQPLCGRLQLKDLLAVVWQRLTKYQLLLEGVLKTILDEDEETEEDIARLKLAVDTAKDVLHRVDSAIRTAENEHRLRSIQSKLEVRTSGQNSAEVDEMRRLDLTAHTLVYEGDLSIRTDTKKSNVLALLLAECLVLLQREGDKFVLKMFQTSQTFQTPIIKWSTVLFRPNAAVKNTFFLMNINVTQMYELSANSPTEYNAWTKYISEAPLAEANKSTRAPSVLQNRERTDDSSGGGVSRNASDASRTSASSAAPDDPPESHSTPEKPADTPSLDRVSVERPSMDRSSVERSSVDREKTPEKPDEKDPNIDTKPRPQLTMNGRITTHEFDPPPLAAAVHVETTATSQFAQKAVSTEERLRRLDEGITKALKAKSLLVGEMLGVPTENFNAVADLAVAETLGQVDVNKDLKAARLERTDSVDTELPPGFSGSGMHQLLLAAQAQANQLTEALTRALNVTESDVVSARHYAPWRDTSGLCDTCTKRRTKDRRRTTEVMETAIVDSAQTAVEDLAEITSEDNVSMTESIDKSKMADLSDKPKMADLSDKSKMADLSEKLKMADLSKSLETSMAIEKEVSFDMLSELGRSCDDDNSEGKKTEAEQRLSSIVLEEIGETSTDPVAGGVYDSALATRLVPLACGLQGTLARLLHALPALEEERARLRRELAAERDAHDSLRRRARGPTTEEAMEPPLEPVDQNGQDQMNNGG